jgi:phage FluMu gp28-like protein
MSPDVPVLRWTQKAEFATQTQEIREAVCEAWLRENVEPHLLQLDRNLPSSLGQDFGRSGDLSVILPIQTYPNLIRRAPFGLELRNIPYEQQRQVLFFICDRLPRFRHAALDGRGNGGYLAEVAMQRYGGLRVTSVMATRQWYADNWPRYKAGLEDRQCVLPSSLDWIDDHRMVEYVRGVPQIPDSKKNKGTDGKPRHGDSAIACLMAWFASAQEGGEIDYESVEIPQDGINGFTVDSGDYYG